MLFGARSAVLPSPASWARTSADRATVGNAETHDRRAEQRGGPLRADFQAEGGCDVRYDGRVAVDRHQHLVRHELALHRDRRSDGRRHGERARRGRWRRGRIGRSRAGRRCAGCCRWVGGCGGLGRMAGRRVGEEVDDQVGQQDRVGVGIRGIGAGGGVAAGIGGVWVGAVAGSSVSAASGSRVEGWP